MGVNSGDRLQLILYPLAPHKCALCFRGSDGTLRFIDFGLNIEWYGSVNFCETCCINVGQAVDMVVNDLYFKDQSRMLATVAELEETKELLSDANRGLDLLRDLFGVNVDHVLNSAAADENPDDESESTEQLTEPDSNTRERMETESAPELTGFSV